MKKIILPILVLSVLFAGCGKNSDTEKMKLENEKLRLQLELAKANGATTTATTTTDFLEIKPNDMSDKEFIEWHRNYQDKEQKNNGGSYPTSLVLKYQKLKEKYNTDAYYYLYARTLSADEQFKLANEMVKKFPKFAYGYNLLASKYYDNPQSIDDVKKALDYAKTGQSLDKDIPMVAYIPAMEQAINAEKKARNMPLEINLGQTIYDKIESTKTGKNKYRIILKQNSYTGEMNIVQNIVKDFTVEMIYKNIVPIVNKNIFAGTETRAGLGFEYQLVFSDPISMGIVFVGEGEKNQTGVYMNRDDIKANKGVENIYLGVSDLSKTDSFVINDLN